MLPSCPQPPAAPAGSRFAPPGLGLGPLRRLAAPLGPLAYPTPSAHSNQTRGGHPSVIRNQNGAQGDSVLPCKVGQRPRLVGPHWSRHTHDTPPHARPCRQGPEPKGQGPSTPHNGRASRRAGRTQLEAPVPSARLAPLDSELKSRKGTASLHWAGPRACGRPGIGPRARPQGPWRRGVWDGQGGSHAHTPAPATHTCMHAHQAHATRTGREQRASAETTVSNGRGSSCPEGLVPEALTSASVSGSFPHL